MLPALAQDLHRKELVLKGLPVCQHPRDGTVDLPGKISATHIPRGLEIVDTAGQETYTSLRRHVLTSQ